MASISTKAIVLSSLKYGDSNLIIKCYTHALGIKSYMLRGILKAKKGGLKAAYFQPLTQLNITANHKEKSTLHFIKEVHVVNPYSTIHTTIVKQSIVIFLSEILASAIQEEETNPNLYQYLEASFLWMDSNEKVHDFHLLFLLNLTKFLGFFPNIDHEETLGFHLVDGNFTNSIQEKNTISGAPFKAFKRLLGMNFDTIENLSFQKNERQVVLEIIIQYFKLQLDGFKQPKSITVLEKIFN